MKRALFCLLAAWCMALAFIGVRAENVTMMTDVFGNERFSVVEEAARRFLRYERKQGNEWKTAWENDAILPDGEMGWLNINGDAGSGQWHTVWFTRETGPQVSVYGSRDEEAEHEDFSLVLEQGPDGDWFVVIYDDAETDLCAWLFEDCVLFCDSVPDIAKGICEEAPNRDAAAFDPEELRTMEGNIVPYDASETERFSVAREDGLNELRLEKKMDGPVIVDLFANAEPLYIALDEKAVCPVHTRPSKVSPRAANGKAAVSLTDWLMLLCRKGDWAFVLYETTPGHYRTGWIEGAQNDRLERAVQMTQEAAFAWYGGTINKDTALMDDPVCASGVLGTVPKGTRATYLDVMEARKADDSETETLVYVETTLNGEIWRGFIREDDIDLDDMTSFG